MLELIADHLEGGFLENIIDMFKHDRGLYALVPGLLADERGRVRIGTVALVEALREEHREEAVSLIPGVAGLLAHESQLVRGDAAFLLGAIGHGDALGYLEDAGIKETSASVREIIEETIEELRVAQTV